MEGTWAVVHDLFEIIGGLAAAIAVGFSVWITTRERADRQQAERDRDEARAAQREAELAEVRRAREAQARRVVLAVQRRRILEARGGHTLDYVMIWTNYSDMPITDVAAVIHGNVSDDAQAFRAMIRPGDSVTFRFEPAGEAGPLNSELAVVFRDAAGVRWRRFADGALAEVPE